MVDLPDTASSPKVDAMSDYRLRMKEICKRFGATIALDGVDLAVRGGQVLALVGENGAGKSTLMKVLSGAHPADEGQMWLDGRPYQPRNPLDARRAGVGMIYQELSLARHLSVMENILLGMEPTIGPFMNWTSIRQRASEAMGQLGRPDIPLEAPVMRLSVAEQQMVEIARAVAIGCRVLILDEPTSSLTKKDTLHLFDLVRHLKAKGHAIVYISHFLEEVKEISDCFTVLRDGHSVGQGVTSEVPTGQIIAMMVGRTVEQLYPRSPRKPGQAVLEVQDLVGSEKPRSASLTLHQGEVLGIAGLVGAGRTELIRTIFGLAPVESGKIRIGAYVGPASASRRWMQGMGIVSEDRKLEGLALSLNIADNVTLSRLPALLTPRWQDEQTNRWIDRLGIKCRSPRQLVSDLSGGNQQKVAVARLLYHDVDVLLLDEPTRGIDVAAKAQIYQVINDLACRGKAVIVVSSYLPELMGICDRIAVMCRGVLSRARPVEEIDEHQIMLEATGAGENV
ncbi:MAG: sugar ABC transporter ATP-binding protein [Sedimentisphaerales bacterium]|nr:sugar ABC transporter ATP-binding protein [Sedimentisphaerales bacterium]